MNKIILVIAIVALVISGASALIGKNSPVSIDKVVGGSTSDNWNVSGNLTVAGTSSLTGNLTLSGRLINAATVTAITNTSTSSPATTTLAVSDSGKVFSITNTSSTVIVLPATSTSAGVSYKFAIGGAIGTNATIVTSDGGNDIEGAMIVAGAVVDCDAEDTITFVADGENVGDFIEIYSNGTDWLIGASGALTASKMTCSAS